MTLDNKVAIVTGSGGEGCGRAIARHFAARRASVVVSDINESGMRETVRLIESQGGRAMAFRADVREVSQIEALIKHAESAYGGLDILVNNASGPYRPGEPLEHWHELIGVDFLGAMHATRLAIDAMRRRGGGAIVSMSSTSALAHGRPHAGGSPAYDAAKAAILRLTTMLDGLATTDNIRVNCLAPDWVATPEVQSYFEALPPERRGCDGIPNRLTPLSEVAELVERLACDESLAGRVLVYWSDDAPRLIPWADPGHTLESV